ncbi:hypothetical protein [Streptomyces sp. RK9]
MTENPSVPAPRDVVGGALTFSWPDTEWDHLYKTRMELSIDDT